MLKGSIGRQILVLLIGLFSALMIAALGMVAADIPASLRFAISSPIAWAISITCTFPILVLLAANQISALLKSSSDRDEIVQEVVKNLPSTSTIIHFDTSAAAMEYLIDNVQRARHIHNTRLSLRDVEESDPENVRLVKRFDAAVWRAIQHGTNYDWIVSSDHESDASKLCGMRKRYATDHKAAGTVCCWILQTDKVPLFHFATLEYTDHCELIIGWALTSSKSFGEKVFLIRDDRLVNYFRELFETYTKSDRARAVAVPVAVAASILPKTT